MSNNDLVTKSFLGSNTIFDFTVGVVEVEDEGEEDMGIVIL